MPDCRLLLLAVVMATAVRASLLPQLDLSPSAAVLLHTRLSIICHGPDGLAMRRATFEISGVKVATVTREGVEKFGDWHGRADVVGSLSQHLAILRLRASVPDTGHVVCVVAGRNRTARSAELPLLVGFPPQTPKLEFLDNGGHSVEWLAESSEFVLRCSAKVGHPDGSLSVDVGSINLLGHKSVADGVVVYTKKLTAAREFDGVRVSCRAANEFGSVRHEATLSVHFVSEDLVVSESVDGLSDHSSQSAELQVSRSPGQSLACNGASNPAPAINWSVPAGQETRLLRHNGLLRVSPKCSLGEYRVACHMRLPTGKTLHQPVLLRVVSERHEGFSPNVVAILVGVGLAFSGLLNGILISLLCRIYNSDEMWNVQHEYTHIPIKKWVTKSMT